jgi:arylsulfatase A-like enzyme
MHGRILYHDGPLQRSLLPALLMGASVLSCGPSTPPSPGPTHPPSSTPAPRIVAPARVVLVVIDTLRRDHLPMYGYAKDTAPYLSRLAREGVVFEHAVSTSAWTAPATASILTGLYPFQHGVVSGFAASKRMQRGQAVVELNRVPKEATTAAELFEGAGYATFGVAENVNLRPEMGFAQGFQRYRHLHREKTADAVHERVLAWRDRWREAERSFLYLHYLDPHSPYLERPPLFDPSTSGAERIRSAYDSEIHYADRHLALAHEALGWDDALIIVTADHGEEFGEHGLTGHSNSLFAAITDVPLIVRFPGGRHAGRRVAPRVSHVDIVPTLRDLLGLPPDPALTGRSLLGLLGGEPWPDRELHAHLLRHDENGQVTKRLHATWADRWKWIGGDPAGPMLFDVAKDPGERENLAAARPELVRGLQARFDAAEKDSRRFAGGVHAFTLDPAKQEELKALGYVN